LQPYCLTGDVDANYDNSRNSNVEILNHSVGIKAKPEMLIL